MKISEYANAFADAGFETVQVRIAFYIFPPLTIVKAKKAAKVAAGQTYRRPRLPLRREF